MPGGPLLVLSIDFTGWIFKQVGHISCSLHHPQPFHMAIDTSSNL
jgi:hypothetical protein